MYAWSSVVDCMYEGSTLSFTASCIPSTGIPWLRSSSCSAEISSILRRRWANIKAPLPLVSGKHSICSWLIRLRSISRSPLSQLIVSTPLLLWASVRKCLSNSERFRAARVNSTAWIPCFSSGSSSSSSPLYSCPSSPVP